MELRSVEKLNRLHVIFKVVERCNINCSYCYYFNMGDKTAFERPAIVNSAQVTQIGDWISHGCQELGINKVEISFHGGEPMLIKPLAFEEACDSLQQSIAPVADLALNIQTNGTILNNEWLEIFDKFSVDVGVSIDGNRTAHNRYRLGHQGESTFDKTEKNLKTLMSWSDKQRGFGVSTISVLNWKNDYREQYKYLRSLGVEHMNFLLPDRNVDDGFKENEGTSERYGECLYEVFESWLEEDNPNVFIRFVNEALQPFDIKTDEYDSSSKNKIDVTNKDSREQQIIVMHSDGSVSINDSYIPALSWYQQTPNLSIKSNSLKGLINKDIFYKVEDFHKNLPSVCQTCEWKNICKGGDLENRFAKRNGFDNPSIYCEGYKTFYQGVCDLLIVNGYPKEAVDSNVKHKLVN